MKCQENQTNCFCDAQCHQVGDCCQPTANIQIYTADPVSYSCVHSIRTFADDDELENYGHWFQAVATCPETSPVELIEYCERATVRKMPFLDVPRRGYSRRTDDANQLISIHLSSSSFRIRKSDVRSMSPVVSTITGRVYANIDCAYCHGELLMPRLTNITESRESMKSVQTFPVQIRCRTYSVGDRLCYANTHLPSTFKRPCGNASFQFAESPRSQHVFSVTSFKWHEFLVLPDFTLNMGDKGNDPYNFFGELDEKTEFILDISQLVLCILSVIALFLLIVLYTLVDELRTHASGQLTIGLSLAMLGLLSTFLCSLLLPYLLQSGPGTDRINHGICMTFATLMHYFFLASFLWTAAFGVALLRTFGGVNITWTMVKNAFTTCCCRRDNVRTNLLHDTILRHPRTQRSRGFKSFLRLTIVPALSPLLLVIPAGTINEIYFMDECSQPGLSTASASYEQCTGVLRSIQPGFCPLNDPNRVWFTGRLASLVWFLIPTAILLGFSCLISAAVGVQIWKMSKMPQFQGVSRTERSTFQSGTRPLANDSRRKKLVTFTRICAHLSVILGTVWIVQLLVNLIPGLPLLYYVTGLLSTGQGLLIALLSFSNPKAKRQWRQMRSSQRTTQTSS
ncbi:hypothetical protein D915_006059 [Fasciola hepatica]|uniref:G-protein coupled receptors family 2 profile 2 domain-containing protein n=1 Tax=Fasciola hepatica TaxID=6192 RepID=A0A4E0RA52_FASHE|nr:hypothetical protein D915_006059 [Fasciola hepatica]